MHVRRTHLWRMLVLPALLTLVMAACAAPVAAPASGGEAASTGPVRGGTLTMSMGDDFVTFHPFYDIQGDDFRPQIFEPVIRISDDGDFEPWLAESWEAADDGLSITLHLRHGVKFHNGREMTADDVIWSIDLARDTTIGHHLSDRFLTCTGAEKIDDYTVKVNYGERTASQLDGLARLWMFPQEAAETIDTVPVGTGPFKFVEWIPGDSLTLERNDDYWQEGLPYLDKIVVKPIPDAQAQLINLRSDSIDLLMYVPLSEKTTLAAEDGLVVGESPAGFSFYAFLMNINQPPFDNIKVRQAFQYAINRDEIAQTAFFGADTPFLVPYAKTSWAYAPDLENYYTYDPEKAKELLAEAGYPDGFSVKLLIRGTSGPHLDQAQVFQQELAAIGVDAELVPTELPQYWPQLYDSNFAIVSHATGDATVDPSGLFEGAACCRPFRNFFGVQDRTEDWFKEYEDVIFKARELSDRTERAALYHRALEILLEQAWTIPTVWNQEPHAYWDYVHGFRIDLDGAIWLDNVYLTK